MKTADLIGPALDWAVAKCEGLNPNSDPKVRRQYVGYSGFAEANGFGYAIKHYSTDWAVGGPIIEREGVYLRANDTVTEWAAGALRKNRLDKKPGPLFYAKTPLVSAMRCYVTTKLGDEVDVPEELLR